LFAKNPGRPKFFWEKNFFGKLPPKGGNPRGFFKFKNPLLNTLSKGGGEKYLKKAPFFPKNFPEKKLGIFYPFREFPKNSNWGPL